MEQFEKYKKVLSFCLHQNQLFLLITLYFFFTLSSLIYLPFASASFYYSSLTFFRIHVNIYFFQLFSVFIRFALFLISIPYCVATDSESYIKSYFSVNPESHVISKRSVFIFCLIWLRIFADIPISHLYYFKVLNYPIHIGTLFHDCSYEWIVSYTFDVIVPLSLEYFLFTSTIIIILSYLIIKHSVTPEKVLQTVFRIIDFELADIMTFSNITYFLCILHYIVFTAFFSPNLKFHFFLTVFHYLIAEKVINVYG